MAAGTYYFYYEADLTRTMQFLDKGLSLSELCGDTNQQCNALADIARLKLRTGDYLTAQAYSHKAQKLAVMSGYFYEEAKARRIEVLCCRNLGDYQECMARSR